jgi:putative transposase
VSIATGFIVWVAGGYPGSYHDLSVSRLSGLFEALLEGELVLADKGYIGEPAVVTPMRQPETDDEWDTNHELSSIRILVEHVNGRLKVFKCLTTPWRHELQLHAVVFHLICNIMNLEFTFHPPHK